MTVQEFIDEIEAQKIDKDMDMVFVDYEGFFIDIGSITVTNRPTLDAKFRKVYVPTVVLNAETM